MASFGMTRLGSVNGLPVRFQEIVCSRCNQCWWAPWWIAAARNHRRRICPHCLSQSLGSAKAKAGKAV